MIISKGKLLLIHKDTDFVLGCFLLVIFDWVKNSYVQPIIIDLFQRGPDFRYV